LLSAHRTVSSIAYQIESLTGGAPMPESRLFFF